MATGEQVLHNSLHIADANKQQSIHHSFQLKDTSIPCFFRDDGLSDLIGFKYSTWHADDAVSDMIHHLENIVEHEPEGSVTFIIMDGENV